METAYRSKHLRSPSYYDVDSSSSQAPPSQDFTEKKKTWYTFQRGLKSPSADDFMTALQTEAEFLRSHSQEQDLEISHLKRKLHTRDQQQADLQAKWNFHSFKYQLLIDMWAMRVLDNESEGGDGEL